MVAWLYHAIYRNQRSPHVTDSVAGSGQRQPPDRPDLQTSQVVDTQNADFWTPQLWCLMIVEAFGCFWDLFFEKKQRDTLSDMKHISIIVVVHYWWLKSCGAQARPNKLDGFFASKMTSTVPCGGPPFIARHHQNITVHLWYLISVNCKWDFWKIDGQFGDWKPEIHQSFISWYIIWYIISWRFCCFSWWWRDEKPSARRRPTLARPSGTTTGGGRGMDVGPCLSHSDKIKIYKNINKKQLLDCSTIYNLVYMMDVDNIITVHDYITNKQYTHKNDMFLFIILENMTKTRICLFFSQQLWEQHIIFRGTTIWVGRVVECCCHWRAEAALWELQASTGDCRSRTKKN